MNVISIMLNVDQEEIYNYWVKDGKPSSIAMAPNHLLKYLFMVTETGSTFEGHGTDQLVIQANPGDEIRWYETPIQPNAAYSICIKDIITHSNWDSYVTKSDGDFVVTKDEQVLHAYYMNKKLRATSSSMDFSSATLKSQSDIGELPCTIYYDFNLSLVEMENGLPVERCKLTFDPGIRIVKAV